LKVDRQTHACRPCKHQPNAYDFLVEELSKTKFYTYNKNNSRPGANLPTPPLQESMHWRISATGGPGRDYKRRRLPVTFAARNWRLSASSRPIRSASFDVTPGRLPASTSAWRTHPRNTLRIDVKLFPDPPCKQSSLLDPGLSTRLNTNRSRGAVTSILRGRFLGAVTTATLPNHPASINLGAIHALYAAVPP